MGFGSSPSYDPPEQQKQAPSIAATPPEPEQVATAPEVSSDSQTKNTANAKRKGTSALRIQLNVGGMSPKVGGTGNGLSI